MVEVKLHDKSVAKFIKRIDRYSKEVREEVQRQAERSAVAIQSNAMDSAPFKSGRYRASIHYKTRNVISGKDRKNGKLRARPPKLGAIVGTNVEYARVIESGSPKRTITAKNQKYLHFKLPNGHWVKKEKVTIPARKGLNVLRNAAKKERPRWLRGMKKVMNKAAKRA